VSRAILLESEETVDDRCPIAEAEAKVEVVYDLSPPDASISSAGTGDIEGLRALTSQVRGVWLEKDGPGGIRRCCSTAGTEDCISHTAPHEEAG
jgi:hypothetical protein